MEERMEKGDPVRKTKDHHKTNIVLPPAAFLKKEVKKEEPEKEIKKGYNGPGTKKGYHKGAFGKCKYLVVKERLLKRTKRSKSVKVASKEKVSGAPKTAKQSAEGALVQSKRK
jgi:hypothetical protein